MSFSFANALAGNLGDQPHPHPRLNVKRSSLLFFTLASTLGVAACAAPKPKTADAANPKTADAAKPTAAYSVVPLAPGHGKAGFDFIGYEPGHDRIWIPYSREGGFVDVYDIKKKSLTHIAGFNRPSAVTFSDTVAFIGDRANGICTVAADTLAPSGCLALPAAPDCVQYVPSTKELWVTTPKASSIVVVDAANPAALAVKATIPVDGEPEGYALDEAHGFFLTNLEDKNRTLRIDLKTRAVVSTWQPGCSDDGPRGLRSAGANVLVACTDGVRVLDGTGAVKGSLDTGAGVDDIFFANERLYVGAGKAARLTIARVEPDGHPSVLATIPTVPRARNAVADRDGNAYVVDPAGPSLLVVPAANR